MKIRALTLLFVSLLVSTTSAGEVVPGGFWAFEVDTTDQIVCPSELVSISVVLYQKIYPPNASPEGPGYTWLRAGGKKIHVTVEQDGKRETTDYLTGKKNGYRRITIDPKGDPPTRIRVWITNLSRDPKSASAKAYIDIWIVAREDKERLKSLTGAEIAQSAISDIQEADTLAKLKDAARKAKDKLSRIDDSINPQAVRAANKSMDRLLALETEKDYRRADLAPLYRIRDRLQQLAFSQAGIERLRLSKKQVKAAFQELRDERVNAK